MSNIDQKLKIALITLSEQTLASIPNEDILASRQTFSRSFERKMNHLIRQARKSDKTRTSPKSKDRASSPARKVKLKRVLVFAIILSLLISVFSVTMAREAIIGFLVRAYDTFSTVIFDRDRSRPPTESGTTKPISESPGPSWIPEGFKQTEIIETEFFIEIVYANDDGNEIVYTKKSLDIDQYSIDTENGYIEDITLNGFEGIFFSSQGLNTVAWKGNKHMYTITGQTNKNNLIKMAESTN
jgi:hypothetical protein